MLTCKVCGAKTLLPKDHANHFSLNHKVSSTSSFLCGYKDCTTQFSSLKRFERHVLLFHRKKPGEPLSSFTNCSNAPHEDSEDFPCPHCDYASKNYGTLRSHIFRYHRKLATKSSGLSDVPSISVPNDEGFVVHDPSADPNAHVPSSDNVLGCGMDGTNVDNVTCTNSDDILNSFSLLYLTLASKYHIPETTLQFILERYYILLKESVSILGKRLLNEFQAGGLDITNLKPVIEKVLVSDVALNIHSPDGCLRSPHMRQKHFSQFFNYVEPIGYRLGWNQNNVMRQHHYVPIQKTLTSLFNDESVYSQYLERQKEIRESAVLKDVQDGCLFKSHELFQSNPSAIQLIIYQDDVELVNPLGSGRCKHKLNAFYYTIGNLHPWNRSRIEPMQLIMLTREVDVSYFGLPRVLAPLIDELKELEEYGIEIRGTNTKVALLVLLGDNLGTHTIGGFVENFSRSQFFCRFCEESRGDWLRRWYRNEHDSGDGTSTSGEDDSIEDNDNEEDDDIEDGADEDGDGHGHDSNGGENNALVLCADGEIACNDREHVNANMPNTSTCLIRTKASYTECVQRLHENPNGVKGVVADSVFNELKYFHIVGATPPCVAHDLFEGIVNYDTYLALNYFEKKFKVPKDYINRRFAAFAFSGEESHDKPAKVALKGSKLGGHAVQNWVFLRFLPLIIGSKINNKQDPVWQMIILLIEIVQIVCSPMLKRSVLPVLTSKIHTYLKLRSQTFKEKLRPKHHFLEHYDHLIHIFGPLMRVCTLRFESKHTFLRNKVRSLRNFKNITKSLAEKHQLLQSALTANQLFNNNPVMGNTVPFEDFTLNTVLSQHIVDSFGLPMTGSLEFSTKVCWRGIEYSKGQVVILSSASHLKLAACKIECVVKSATSLFVGGSTYEAVLINELQMYKLQETGQAVLAQISELADFVPLSVYKLSTGHSMENEDSNIDNALTPANEDLMVHDDVTSSTLDLVLMKLKPSLMKPEDEPSLLKRLNNLGVETLSDLNHLNWEEDLAGLIKPIQCRKLQEEILKDLGSPSSATPPQHDVACLYHLREDLFSNKFTRQLSENKRLTTTERLKVIRIVSEDMYDTMKPLPKNNDCQKIAKLLVTKWPAALKDTQYGKGYEGLGTQLFRHIEYIRRKERAEKQSSCETGNWKRKRPSQADKYGIADEFFLPDTLPQGETPGSQAEKQKWLQTSAKVLPIDWRKVESLMEETYASQRGDILNRSMDQILECWPFIGTFKCMKRHFYRLMQINEEQVVQQLAILLPKFLEFVKAEANCNVSGSKTPQKKKKQERLITILKEMDAAEKTPNIQLVGTALCVAVLLDQDMDVLCVRFDETASYDEITASPKIGQHPIIAVLGEESLLKSPKCFVFLDKCGLHQQSLTPRHALLSTFMAHYVFSIKYHSKLAGLWEFFQRSIFKIDGKGSKTARGKGGRQPPAIQPKYDGLMRKYDNYCEKWSNRA